MKISSNKWNEIYEHFFKSAIESAGYGYRCIRSEITTGSFTKEIIENLKNAHLVLADITGFNGNVMWELGVRHALSTRTIIVTNKDIKAKKFISDLSIYGVVEYSIKSPKQIIEFNNNIKKILKKIKENPEKADNPVFDFLKIEDLVMKTFEKKQIRNKLTGLLSELFENLRVAEIHIDGENPITKDFVGFYRFNKNAIDELTSTNYIYTEGLNEEMSVLANWIHHANTAMQTLSDFMDAKRSDEDRQKIADQTIMYCKEIKKRVEKYIPRVNKILDTYENIELDVTPNVLISKEEHRKLLK
ncbi:hypothetical protein [Nitrosopumilus sp.]|uniref:hypothetical protein n=1 Tax=Nitrosopumilus sp. TaxID=2024843 RepID=UPI00247B4E26|nr:hypothetical protein [Nitrosopumilus sp.]MCV0411165.1 hypothetical protein [Nitrosopumilus sp.]